MVSDGALDRVLRADLGDAVLAEMRGRAPYVAGRGPLAGVALEAVLAECPAHRMAGLLDVALQNGLRPEDIRGLLAGLPAAGSV